MTKDQEGQDGAFLAWIRTLPSCINGETPVQACHVRRVKFGSGTGIKPPYAAVPLTAKQHAIQHTKGEQALLVQYGIIANAKEWFEDKALYYRRIWNEKQYAHRESIYI